MATWWNRQQEAQEFWAGAEAKAAAGRHRNALSLAFHAVIAANAAVVMRYARLQPRGDSHAQAAKSLRHALRGTSGEVEATEKADSFHSRMRSKTPIEYTARRLSAEEAERLLKPCRRFATWAARVAVE